MIKIILKQNLVVGRGWFWELWQGEYPLYHGYCWTKWGAKYASKRMKRKVIRYGEITPTEIVIND